MLILTRKVGETIKIGERISVTVLEIRDGRVRIGIDAPKDVVVHRDEVYERIRRAEPQAS